MLVKEITYTDFNGEKQTGKFYFNITKTELTNMSLDVKGGIETILKEIAETQDNVALMKLFKKIIESSYGIKSVDGQTFEKSKKITKKFINSAAYDELFIELFSDSNKLNDFIRGILPKDIRDQIPSDDELNKAQEEGKLEELMDSVLKQNN